MILQLFGIAETPTNQFALLLLGGMATYFFASGLFYLVIFILGRDRLLGGFTPDAAENRRAMVWGVLGTIGNAVLTLPIHLAIAHHFSRIYWDVSDYGWAWLIASVPIYLVCTETCVYWAHRWLHTYPWLYRKIHAVHHSWRENTSWVSMAFHPLDSFAQALPHHLFGFFFPLHGAVYLFFLNLSMIWTVIIHSRVRIMPGTFINHTDHHTVHHWVGDYNYGQFTTVWDKIMGSWRDPAVLAEQDPGLAAQMSHPLERTERSIAAK